MQIGRAPRHGQASAVRMVLESAVRCRRDLALVIKPILRDRASGSYTPTVRTGAAAYREFPLNRRAYVELRALRVDIRLIRI